MGGHTSYIRLNSADAFSFGARLSPADAYRFARGDEVKSNTGQIAKLKRPLDFLVVADHAEGLGIINELVSKATRSFMSDAKAKRWHEMLNDGNQSNQHCAGWARVDYVSWPITTLPKTMRNPLKIHSLLMRSIWKRNTASSRANLMTPERLRHC